VTKKSPKDNNNDEEVSKRASKNSGPETEKGDSSSEGTPPIEDGTKTDRKRKQVDHLEGEFKKIKPLMNPGQEKKQRHGCWTSKSISKSTTIPTT
jgi:hypothetical protein